ncbi:hypothetical protein SCHPADRAFT_172875 [Schizopora paradoxa]|uniref:Uncharacterized protein n=1 Tax=Schizopora paradoxa TaxID=27342 RepID=A0A0H2RYX7_9AGAM|nr:hypothetical protein SCHPADRAFT_172875 [Schizopora paradoxa]
MWMTMTKAMICVCMHLKFLLTKFLHFRSLHSDPDSSERAKRLDDAKQATSTRLGLPASDFTRSQ